jgi:hypothetical protein
VTDPESHPNARRRRAAPDEARPKPAPYLTLCIEDSAYVDPIMDAWGRGMARGVIAGIEAGWRRLSGALANG